MKTIKFLNNKEIPQIGLGVFRAEDGIVAENAVKWALEAGYRHIDTAMIYGNEESVGKAVKESNIKREEIFITTKLWNEDIRQGRVKEAFEKSLKRLQMDYVDLYLIHWPATGYEAAWNEIVKLYKKGYIKTIGVSNFHKHHLENLEKNTELMPFVNQIESHPYMNNQELIDYCLGKGIQIEVWSPLGGSKGNNVREDPELIKIAKKYNKSTAQIIIRWDIQRNVIVLPKSVHKERIESNVDVFDFKLTDDEMKIIFNINKNERVGSDPDNFNF